LLTAAGHEVTALLVSAEAGADVVWDRLVLLVYGELRTFAHVQLTDKHSSNTLTTLGEIHGPVSGPALDLLELDLVLTRLAENYPCTARAVECRFVGGPSTVFGWSRRSEQAHMG